MRSLTFIILIILFVADSFSQVNTVRIRLSPSTGSCAPVFTDYPDTSFPGHHDLLSIAWTRQGVLAIGRTFFKFNLTGIPSNAQITSAYLNLYANPDPWNPHHYWLDGTNESYLRRVVSNWNVNTVDWINQPAYTTLNQIFLPQSYDSMENYLNIDVKTHIQDMVQNPSSNYGFMLQLNYESIYRCMNFASYICIDTSKRPLLIITYNPIGIKPISSDVPKSYELYQNYPNPFNPSTTIEFDIPRSTNVKLFVYDVLGRIVQMLVNENVKAGSYKVNFEKNNISSGIYFYKLVTDDLSISKKLMVIQ